MPDPYMDTLLRAASSLGSSQDLAQQLHVEYDQLRKWMRGEEVPPHDILVRAVELITKQKELRNPLGRGGGDGIDD